MPVQFYDPGGKVAAAARAQAVLGPRTAAKPQPRQPTQHGSFYEMGLRDAVKAPVQTTPIKEPEQPSGPGGILGRGLGMVLNNPISRTILRPLDVLDVPRRAVWSTINEVADAFNGGDASLQDWYDQTNPFHVVTQKGDTTFGAGSVLPDVDTPLSEGWDQWINRGIGLTGDIFGDPLTYLPGVGVAATAARTAEGLGKLNLAQKAAAKALQSEDAFRALGFLDEAAEAAPKVASYLPAPAAGAEDAFSALGFAGQAVPTGPALNQVPDALRGSMERLAALGDESDLERLGQRSLTGANEAQRTAMNLGDQRLQFHIPVPIPGVKLGYHNIPGTGALAERGAAIKAATKLKGRGLPGMESVREKLAPTGILGNSLHPAYERILTGRGGDSIRPAIEAIGQDNAARLAGGKFSGVARTYLERLAKRVKDQTPEQRFEAVRQAEEDLNVTNEWTDFSEKMIAAAKYAGADLPELRNGRYVMPHVLNRGFRNHLMELIKKNDPRAKSFMRDTELKMDDLLEEGGFMQRRAWRPNDDGTPFVADIGGRKVSIETGSIDELNRKIGEAFPDYTGPIYETDPILAWRGYIQATTKDVAKRSSFRQAALAGNEGIFTAPTQPEQYDPFGGREDLPGRPVEPKKTSVVTDDTTEPTIQPVQRITAQAQPTLTPEQRQFYTSSPNEKATAARNKEILKTQPALLKEYVETAEARRIEIAEELEKITVELTKPISDERGRLLREYQKADATGRQAEKRLDEIANETAAIEREQQAIADELKEITTNRAAIKRTAKHRPAERQGELMDELTTKEAELIEQLDQFRSAHAARQGPEGGDAGVALARIREAAPERRQALIHNFGERLQQKLGNANEKLVNARRRVKLDWHGRGEFSIGGKPRHNTFGGQSFPASATNPMGFEAANKYIADNAKDLRWYHDLTQQRYELLKEFHGKINSEISRIDEEIAQVDRSIAKYTAQKTKDKYIAYRDTLIGQRRMLERQKNELTPKYTQLTEQLRTPKLRAIEEALEHRATHRRWLNKEAMDTGSDRSRVAEYQRQLDEWNNAVDADAAGPIPTGIEEAAPAAVSPEVAKAQKYLKTDAAFNYIRDRNRYRNLTDQYIKSARDPDIQNKLAKERYDLGKSLEKRTKIKASVEAAENKIKRNGAEEVIEEAPVAPAAAAVEPTPTPEPEVLTPEVVEPAAVVPRDAADPRLPASIEGAPLPPRNMEGNPLTADDMWNMPENDPRWEQLAAFPGFDPEIAEFWARNMDTPPADMFRGPTRTPAEYNVMRNLMQDDLGRAVEEGSTAFDNIDSIYNLSDQETDKLISEVFDLLTPNTQTFWNLRGRVGQADEAAEALPTAAVPEQAALPPAPAAEAAAPTPKERSLTPNQLGFMNPFADGEVHGLTSRQAAPLVRRGYLEPVSGKGMGAGNTKLFRATEEGRDLARRIEYDTGTHTYSLGAAAAPEPGAAQRIQFGSKEYEVVGETDTHWRVKSGSKTMQVPKAKSNVLNEEGLPIVGPAEPVPTRQHDPLDYTGATVAGTPPALPKLTMLDPEDVPVPLGPTIETNPTGMLDIPTQGSSSIFDVSDTSLAARKVNPYTTRGGARGASEPMPPTVPPKHPYLEEIDARQRRAEQEAKALANPPPGGADQTMVPQINKTQQELADIRARKEAVAAGTDEEFNAIPGEQQAAADAEYDALGQRREELKAKKKALNKKVKVLDDETGEHQQTYIDAIENHEKYRAQHRAIADKADPIKINRASARVEMKPMKNQLDEVAEGTLPAYEAQPLHRTIRDINELVAANPRGDDELLARAEAALMPIEKQLAELTTQTDLPARQVEQIVKAARNGSLAPVVSYHLKSNFRTVWDGGDVIIRNDIDQAYHRITKMMQDPGPFSRTLLAFTNFFKTYATLTPGFHIRNALSAIFMNTVEGVPLGTQREGLALWRQYAKAEDPLVWLKSQDQQIQDAFASVFSSGAGGRYTEAGFAKTSAAGRRKQTAFNNPATRLSQKVGQDWVEGPVRMGMALDSVRRGDDVQAAMRRITRIHFDYSQVSEFDEKAKRLIPFWTFMSRNIPMQITEMWSRPRVYAWFNSFMRNVEGDPVEGTPEYFEQLGATPFGNIAIAGMPLFLQPDLGHRRLETDLSDMENFLSGENLTRPLTNLNPFATAIPEYIAQKDLYTGRDYKPTDVRKLGPLEKLGQPVLDMLGLLKTADDGTKLVEERLPNMLQALNPLYARSASLMPNLTTGGGDDIARQGEAWARTALGLPLRTLSPQQQQNTQRSEFFQARDARALRDAMNRAAAS